MKSLKFFFFFIFTFSLFHNFTLSQWVLQVTGTTNVMLDIDYVTPQNGGLVLACAIDGKVYRSSNGGANWTVVLTEISTPLSDIEFTDINTGYAAGSQGKIIKTVNSGLNWTVLDTDTTNNYTCIFFVNASTGFICGSGTSSGVILKTTNSGANWSQVAVTTQSNQLQSIFFTDNSTGWAAGYNGSSFIGSVLKTTNGGASWQDILVSSQVELFIDIYMLNSSSGFTSSSTGISKTTNGGINLIQSFVPANTQLDLEFINSQTGYSCGAPGLIYKTTNSGLNWLQQPAPGGSVPLRTVSMIGDTGFVCGANGTILKTTNGGNVLTGIQITGSEIPNAFSLEQNYPNPFNPSTTINFNIPLSLMYNGLKPLVRLAVYDILGKEAAVLVNENLSAGFYTIDFNASSLPSGTYLYRLTAGEFSQTKKFVIIK